MGLSYEEDNYLPRSDVGYYDYLSTQVQSGLEVHGSSVASQNRPYSLILSASGISTLTQDVILTFISINIDMNTGGVAENTTATALINNNPVSECRINLSANRNGTNQTNIFLPNWKIKTGETLGSDITGAGSLTARIIFIGYLA